MLGEAVKNKNLFFMDVSIYIGFPHIKTNGLVKLICNFPTRSRGKIQATHRISLIQKWRVKEHLPTPLPLASVLTTTSSTHALTPVGIGKMAKLSMPRIV